MARSTPQKPGTGASSKPGEGKPKAKTPSGAKRAKNGSRPAYSTKDLVSAMRQVSMVRSIPKGPAKGQAELFSSGALKSFQFAPAGQGYYDAFAQKPDSAVMSVSVGPCTCVKGHSSDVVTGSARASEQHGNAKLVVFDPGSSDNVTSSIGTVTMD